MNNKTLSLLALLSVTACGLPTLGTAPELSVTDDRLNDAVPSRDGKDALPADVVNNGRWASVVVCLGPSDGTTVPVLTDADCQALCYNANLERKLRLEQGLKACGVDFRCDFLVGDTTPDGQNACSITPIVN